MSIGKVVNVKYEDDKCDNNIYHEKKSVSSYLTSTPFLVIPKAQKLSIIVYSNNLKWGKVRDGDYVCIRGMGYNTACIKLKNEHYPVSLSMTILRPDGSVKEFTINDANSFVDSLNML